MTETWRPVVGFEATHQVSDQGRVRAVDRVIHYKDGRSRRYPAQVLKPTMTPHNQPKVTIAVAGRNSHRLVQRLVLEAFVGAPPPGRLAAHLDGDNTNNALSNLAWKYPTHTETHCRNGHEFTPATTGRKRPEGGRSCLECRKERR